MELQLKLLTLRKIYGWNSANFELKLHLLIFRVDILLDPSRLLILFILFLEGFEVRLKSCHELLIIIAIRSANVGFSEVVDAVRNDLEEVARRENAHLLVFLLSLKTRRTESLFKHCYL